MSQVIRKYSNGKPIKLDDSKLFQREGFGVYKREDIANNLAKGLEQFIADEKMNEEDAQMFRSIVGQAIEGTRNGQFTKMDTSGIHNTMNWNSSGKTEGKKFLGINVGGQRAFDKSAKTDDGRNNALNALNRFYTKTLDSMSTYNYDNELKSYNDKNPKDKYNANTFLTDAISREWYGGNGIDWDNFSKNRTEKERRDLLANIINGINYDELFNKYDWSNTNIKSAQDLANLYKAFGANIANGTLDNNDYNSFAALGGTNLNQFITGMKPVEQSTQSTQGQVGKVDTTWNNPDYDRTIDDKGQYHIYKKGTGEEINGILPGNVFEGVGNKYAFNGNIYDDSNLPEQYRQDINRARQAQLENYTQLTDNNPFTKMLKGQGYNYITNLSQFASGIGNNILYGTYSNPLDVNGKMGYYLKDPVTGKAISGNVEYNNTLGQYQFISNNGSVTNLGTYNKNGALTNQGTTFVNYNDTSSGNLNRLMGAWMRNTDLKNPASDAYKMVQNTLSKWIPSGNSPFKNEGEDYVWNQGDYYMRVRKDANGQWQWVFNDKLNNLNNIDENQKQLEALLKIPVNQRTREINDQILRLQGFKQGGIITAQLGVKFEKVDDPSTIQGLPEASEEQKEKARLVGSSFKKQQNINLGTLTSDTPYGENKKTVDAGGILKDADKLKLKAALVDLAGTGLGFIPGMNIASAVTGVGASATNFYADLQDGFQWGDLGNLAMNLGMDALSLIPIGKSAKTLKALGTISKSAPLIMTALNAMGLADPELRASYASTLNKIKNINKIDSLKSLNTGDIQNLNAMLGMVLGGKNFAKSHKGFWNTNTTNSGKRKVTAMIDGKQQSLELDEAFFQNTKGKNQVQELKNKFAEQYNKQNKLEGDKAIKPENVAVDTKYFGKRPQSEKVSGTKNDGNWITNNMIGRYFLGYEDPSIPKGLDAMLLRYKPQVKPNSVQTESNTASTGNTSKETGLVPTGKRNEYFDENARVQENIRQEAYKNSTLQKAQQQRKQISDNRRNANKKVAGIFNKAKTQKFLPTPGEMEIAKYRENAIKGANQQRTDYIQSAVKQISPAQFQLPTYTMYPNPKPRTILTLPKRSVLEEPNIKFANWTERQRKIAQNREDLSRQQAQFEQIYDMLRQQFPIRFKNKSNLEIQKAIDKSLKAKTANRINRTSKKANGGLFKDGGLIPKFENPAGPIRMQAKSKNYFDRNSGLSGYNFGADVDAFLKHGTLEDYIIGFNGREDNYDALVKASGGTYGNRSYISNPLATAVQSAMLTYNPGFDKYIRQNIQGYGVTEGQTTGTDKHFGDRTWERTLGRNITADQAKYFNDTYLKGRGLELYDKGDGGYRLRLLSQAPASNSNTSVQTLPPVSTNSTSNNLENGVVGTSTATSKNSKGKFSLYPEDVLSLAQLFGGIFTNNKIASLSKTRSLETNVPDRIELLQGDAMSKAQAHKYSSDLQNLAGTTTTSDAQQQFAKMLEAKMKGISIDMQGDAKDTAEWFRTRGLVQQANNENTLRRYANANENSARRLATETANKQIDASNISANWAQMIAPFLAGVGNKYAQNRASLRQYQLEKSLNNQNTAYQIELSSLYKKYKDDIPEFNNQKQLLDSKYKQLILDEKKSLLSNPWLINYAKSGSKLGYKERAALQRAKDFNKRLLEDNKRFHKDVMESKREHNKLLKQMSSLTAALIKKGLKA